MLNYNVFSGHLSYNKSVTQLLIHICTNLNLYVSKDSCNLYSLTVTFPILFFVPIIQEALLHQFSKFVVFRNHCINLLSNEIQMKEII